MFAIGTDKGGYLIERDGSGWTVSDPLFPGWRVSAFGRAADGTYLAGVGSNWFGCAVHRSGDGRTWEQVVDGPSHGEDRKLDQIWTFHTAADGTVYAGVAEAGLFTSSDDGATWSGVGAINDHPHRATWQPGLGGLAAHRIVESGDTMWLGISAVGVFRTRDGGESFDKVDAGISQVVEEDPPGYCVHSLAGDPGDSSRLWRQDHSGVYRTTDGGDTWERTEHGLPAAFGFVMVRHDPTGRLFTAPLEADANRVPVHGSFGLYRSDDDGSTWSRSGTGWPESPTYTSVLRNAACVTDAGKVMVGTTGGDVWFSEDVGDAWSRLPMQFPRILAVADLS